MTRFLKAEMYKLGRNKLSVMLPIVIGMIILGMACVLKNTVKIDLIYDNLEFVALGAFFTVVLVFSILFEEISAGTLKNLQESYLCLSS